MAVISLQLLVHTTLLLTFWTTISSIATASSSELAWPIAKPNCETHCGNISIPYPFGIGPNKDCYFDEWFEIECAANNSSTSPPKPFLRHTQPKLEVLNISMEGTLLVNNPVTFFYDGNRTRQLGPEFDRRPFHIFTEIQQIHRNELRILCADRVRAWRACAWWVLFIL